MNSSLVIGSTMALLQRGGRRVARESGSRSPVPRRSGAPRPIGRRLAVSAATEFENEVCTDKAAEPGMIDDSTADTDKAFETGEAGMYLSCRSTC
jgi:hypothetical protein